MNFKKIVDTSFNMLRSDTPRGLIGRGGGWGGVKFHSISFSLRSLGCKSQKVPRNSLIEILQRLSSTFRGSRIFHNTELCHSTISQKFPSLQGTLLKLKVLTWHKIRIFESRLD